MPSFFRFYTAQNWATRFYFGAIDSADHISYKTGLTGFTIQYTVNGGAYASWAGAAVTEIGNGLYYFDGPATASHSSTYGELGLKITATGMDPFLASLSIVAFNPGEPNRFNMSCLPQALPGTLGGLIISGTSSYTLNTDGVGYVGVFFNSDKTNYSLSSAANNSIAIAVWNATLASFVTAGTFGKKISDWILDPWDVSLPGAYGSGKAGRILGLNLDTTVSSRSSLDAGAVATSVLAALDNPNIELGAIPTSTSGLKAMIQYIFAYFRNKRSASSSVETLYAEDATTPLGTASISEAGGTVTKGEMS